MNVRLSFAAIVAVLTVLISAGSAVADTTTVGELTLTPNNGNADLISPAGAPVFQGAASGNYTVSSPQTGVITSWSFLSAGIAPGAHFELRVLSPVDASATTWRAVATSDPEVVSSASSTDAVNGPFAADIAIEAGDRIALEPVDGGSTPIESGVNGQDGIRYFIDPLADGSSAPLAPGSDADNGQIVPIQATVQYTPATTTTTTTTSKPHPPNNSKPPQILGNPVDGRTLTCDPGTWSVDGPYAFAWTETTLVPTIVKNQPEIRHVTTSLGTNSTVGLGDLPPGITTIGCAVTVGSTTVAATPVTVEPLRPVPGPKVVVKPGSHEASSPNPTITPGVGYGGENVCTSGRWLHYPTSYTYYWYSSGATDPSESVEPHPPITGYGLVAKGSKLSIAPKLENHRLLCAVTASNAAGSLTALSNSYRVPASAPMNLAIPDVIGTVTAPATNLTRPLLNPPKLTGNSISLLCDPGKWNRPDLTYAYTWVFDQDDASQSPPAPLHGLTYSGNALLIKLVPESGYFQLEINGSPPGPGYAFRLLDDDVQCEVTATSSSGKVSAVAVSRTVHLKGPTVSLDDNG